MSIRQENQKWKLKRIVQLRKQGSEVSEIAKMLFLSERTVYYYIKLIKYIPEGITEPYITVRPKEEIFNAESIPYYSSFWKEHPLNTCLICGQECSNEICLDCEIDFPVKR